MQTVNDKIRDGIDRIVSANLFLSNKSVKEIQMTKKIIASSPNSIKICSVEGCEGNHYSKSFCEIHYKRHWRNRFTQLKAELPKSFKICSVADCNSKHFCKSFCIVHYGRYSRNGFTHLKPRQPKIVKFCSLENCQRPHYAKGFCLLHHRRNKKHGNPLYSESENVKSKTISERFFEKVEKGENENDCWKWNGAILSNGYGQITINRKRFPAHRLSFEVHHNYKPKDFVLHSCDNPPCCNPLHLREGTQLENMQDKTLRNRQPKFWRRGRTNLILSQVKEIRIAISNGEKTSLIAKRFEVSVGCIGSIRRGTSWKPKACLAEALADLEDDTEVFDC